MDELEASAVLRDRVAELRELSYGELRERFLLDNPVRADPTWQEARGASGATYWLKIYAYWDSDARDDLRVFVDVADRSRHWYQPVRGDDFIVAPDGSSSANEP